MTAAIQQSTKCPNRAHKPGAEFLGMATRRQALLGGTVAEDIRISIGFFDHPKTVKLRRRLGSEGVESLMRLWCFCAHTPGRSAGDLRGMDAEDLAITGHWDEEPEDFEAALHACGFIENRGDGLWLHDYTDSQPWAGNSDARKFAGKQNSLRRWHKQGRHTEFTVDCPLCAEKMPRVAENLVTDATLVTPVTTSKRNAITSRPQCSGSDSGSDPDSDPGSNTKPVPVTRIANTEAAYSKPQATWEVGDGIDSTAQLEVMVGVVCWSAGNIRAKDRKLCHDLTQAAKIEPWEVEAGLEAVTRVEPPPANPVSYFLGVIRGERQRAAEPQNTALAAVPKKRDVVQELIDEEKAREDAARAVLQEDGQTEESLPEPQSDRC